MTNSTYSNTLLGITLLTLSFTATANDCDKDDAMAMYSAVSEHAEALKFDAQDYPSKIPFQKGKNDPRLKKSIKINAKASAINKESISTEKYSKACGDLAALAKKYKIKLYGDGSESTLGDKYVKGIKTAGQAQSLRNQLLKK